MSSYRNLVIIVLLLLVVGGGLAIWNADRKLSNAPVTNQSASQDQGPAMTGHNVSFIVTEGEIKKWKLISTTAIYNETNTEADLVDVKGEFYGKDGKPVLQFTAPKGHYTNKDNAVTLTGGVVAKSTQKDMQGGTGGDLTAPTMVWSAKTNNVTASGGIHLTSSNVKSTAQVCRFSLDFSKITLEGGVSSSIIQQ